MRSSRIGVLAATGAAALALTACGGSGGSDGSSTGGGSGGGSYVRDGSFTVALRGKPDNLDPHRTVLEFAINYFQFTYDYLVTVDGEGRLQPALATRWEETPRSVTFTLADGVTCSDGSPVTATTVKQNLDLVKDPRVQSSLLGVAVPDGEYTVSADDRARTVTVRLGAPNGQFVTSLQLLPIICGRGLRDRSLLQRASSGSGPYELTSIDGDRYTLTRRDDYRWGPGGADTSAAGLPRTVELRAVPNPSTTANLLLSGDVGVGLVTGADGRRLQQSGLTIRQVPWTVAFTWFNQARGRPTADPDVRRALAMTLPREDLSRILYGGAGEVGDGILSGKLACDDDAAGEAIPTGDAAAAAALLDQAGWREGGDGIRSKDGQRLTLTAPYDGENGGFAAGVELIQQAWRAIGVELKPRSLGTEATVAEAFAGSYDVLPLFEVGATLPGQFSGFVSGPAPDAGQNFGHVANADYERLSAQARGKTGEAGCRLWTEAHAALLEQSDVVPVVEAQSSWYLGDDVQLDVNSLGPIPTSIRMLAD